MSDLHDPGIWEYLLETAPEEPDLLKELNRETHVKVLKPRMLSGHYQGRFLSLLSKILNPLRILEIGTFTGYSTLCLAEGLQEKGIIYTLEANPEPLVLARKYFERSPLGRKIRVFEGEALMILDNLKEKWDLVFIDADKKNNQKYFEKVFDNVRPGGLILVDNVLWSGKILNNQKDRKTEEIHGFNQFLHAFAGAESIILPIRDGISLVRKKEDLYT